MHKEGSTKLVKFITLWSEILCYNMTLRMSHRVSMFYFFNILNSSIVCVKCQGRITLDCNCQGQTTPLSVSVKVKLHRDLYISKCQGQATS